MESPAGAFYRRNVDSGERSLCMRFDYQKNRFLAENLSIVLQIGLTMVGCIGFCFFVGRYLDKWLHTSGAFTVLLTILGVLGGANVVYRQILEVVGTTQNENRRKRSGNNGENQSFD